jgi:predicted secreted protein
MISTLCRILAAIGLALAFHVSVAAEKPALDGTEVLLRAEAELMLPNDEVRIVFFAHEQSPERNKAIAQVIRRVKAALEALKSNDASARIESGSYYSSAVYGQRKINGPGELLAWEARQSITVTTAQIDGVADLVGKVQAFVDVGSVQFGLSRDSQRKLDAKLFDMAFEDLRARLANVARVLGKSEQDVEIEQIDLTGNDLAPQMRLAAAPMAAVRAGQQETPSFEPGESRRVIAFNTRVRVRH